MKAKKIKPLSDFIKYLTKIYSETESNISKFMKTMAKYIRDRKQNVCLDIGFTISKILGVGTTGIIFEATANVMSDEQ